jgi:hypothetical protein
MKRGWFPGKKTCLNNCEQHEFDKPVYLYIRVVIPTGWVPFILKSKYQNFCWQVKAHLAIRGKLDRMFYR